MLTGDRDQRYRRLFHCRLLSRCIPEFIGIGDLFGSGNCAGLWVRYDFQEVVAVQRIAVTRTSVADAGGLLEALELISGSTGRLASVIVPASSVCGPV
jgi:hypothetical protein